MSKKIYVLSVFLFLLSISAYAQINADIVRPSVNADQFGLAAKAEAALNKGQVSLNIPLMTLKGKGYDLPISLAFYNGDVTFSTEASPVGLGWALITGGVITMTTKGTNDLDNDFPEHHYNENYIEDRFDDPTTHGSFLDEILYDPMPDEYTYSLPGHSGIIEVSINNNTIERSLFPDESYIIEPISPGFCITADDGTKFYFEDYEFRGDGVSSASTSLFLTRIETTKGGFFNFTYEDEEYVDLSTEDGSFYKIYRTKRISSITSDFGSVQFYATTRSDRGNINSASITQGYESKRINRIEMRDENGAFVKGYDLDNSDSFVSRYAGSSPEWYDYRHKLSTITQYDSIGNRLPPYRFAYSYKFAKPKRPNIVFNGNEAMPRDSWTACISRQAYVDLDGNGVPLCRMLYPGSQYAQPDGITVQWENISPTANDFFCLDSIYYPNGALEVLYYEDHNYSKVNETTVTTSSSFDIWTLGKRLARKTRFGTDINQNFYYIYRLHDENYDTTRISSGVLTNPSIHYATYYTPEPDGLVWKYRASRISSDKAFNSFMGPPVCYTEVEEIETDEYNFEIISRTIHYFEPQIVSPPVNYIFVLPHHFSVPYGNLVKIENRIHGTISGYRDELSYLNNTNLTYMTYPLGEFSNVSSIADQPLKEVYIGKDGNVRSIKQYTYTWAQNYKKYGYRAFCEDHYNNSNPQFPTLYYTTHYISRSEYVIRKARLDGALTTTYFYDGETRDSICESNGVIYNKGRVAYSFNTRGNESKSTKCYYPGDIQNIVGNTSPAIGAINGLIENNIVADPIKTVVKRNGQIIGGECRDYQMLSGEPLLKSVYKFKNTAYNYAGAPTVNGNDIDYLADLYKEGEIMTYDEYLNPEHVRINNTLDRIYVWGYGGRFPIAVIDNMDYTTFQAATNLKSQILQLATYRNIENAADCASLRSLNAIIRAMLPVSAHITTYTYDPYFGMTSEINDSNLGTIYTYDTFGRLSGKYDVNYKQLEEYNYHFKLQH